MKTLAYNRDASREYLLLENFSAGVQLFGYEVKAVREGKVDFEGSFVKIVDGRPQILNLNIGRYSSQGNMPVETDARRTRPLLLKKYEIERIDAKANQKGFTLVPLKLITDHGLIKLEFALAKGKKVYQKKEDLKTKQVEKDLKIEEKNRRRI